MAKIRGIGNRKGLVGQTKGTGRTIVNANRSRVNQSTVSRRSVKRLFARDPSKANSLIGTTQDLRFDQQNVNTNRRPTIRRQVKAPTTAVRGAGKAAQTGTATGVRKVVARTNRALRKR